jgi:hypothetical protein
VDKGEDGGGDVHFKGRDGATVGGPVNRGERGRVGFAWEEEQAKEESELVTAYYSLMILQASRRT